MKRLICVLFIAAALLGCSVEPSSLSNSHIKETAEKMKFTSIRIGNKFTSIRIGNNDVCFGFVASRKTGHTSQSGLGAVWVPRELVKDKLINQEILWMIVI